MVSPVERGPPMGHSAFHVGSRGGPPIGPVAGEFNRHRLAIAAVRCAFPSIRISTATRGALRFRLRGNPTLRVLFEAVPASSMAALRCYRPLLRQWTAPRTPEASVAGPLSPGQYWSHGQLTTPRAPKTGQPQALPEGAKLPTAQLPRGVTQIEPIRGGPPRRLLCP